VGFTIWSILVPVRTLNKGVQPYTPSAMIDATVSPQARQFKMSQVGSYLFAYLSNFGEELASEWSGETMKVGKLTKNLQENPPTCG
jgi:hypothetical protein